MKFFRNIKSLSAILLFIFFSVNIANNIGRWNRNKILQWDVCGYHNYLPAVFIYHDLVHFKYYDDIDNKYSPTGQDTKRYALLRVDKTNKTCNQYPIGVAIFQAPFFLIAHCYTLLSDKYLPDGYSSPYQLATLLCSIFYVFLGLLILRKFLLNYFYDSVVMLTMLIICFGTNLFNYTSIEPGLSHPYLFFLYCSILYLTNSWYQQVTIKSTVLLGICIGLCAIVRPLDVLVFLIPLFWSKSMKYDSLTKLEYLKKYKYHILLIIFCTFVTVLPQMFYWKYVTGNWIYYSYSKLDYFEFDRFRVFHGLFSYRKGWFVYSPLLLLGFFGIFLAYRNLKYRFYVLPFWLFFIPMIYLVFSWHNWFYGWGFGCRALMQTISILAFPICICIEALLNKRIITKVISLIIISSFVFFSMFQTWQYDHGILHGILINKKYYWRVFGKTEVNADDLKIIEESQLSDDKNDW